VDQVERKVVSTSVGANGSGFANFPINDDSPITTNVRGDSRLLEKSSSADCGGRVPLA
jgi:hypothetical protein